MKSCSECCGGIMLHLGRNIFVINYPYIVHAANVIQYNISLRVGCEKVPRIASVDWNQDLMSTKCFFTYYHKTFCSSKQQLSDSLCLLAGYGTALAMKNG